LLDIFPAFVAVAAEPAEAEAALFVLRLNAVVSVLAVDVRALVELVPKVALRHLLAVTLVKIGTVVAFVAQVSEPVQTNFSLELRLVLGRQRIDVALVARTLVLVNLFDHRLEVECDRALRVRREEPHRL
jgi:hypothetical protein